MDLQWIKEQRIKGQWNKGQWNKGQWIEGQCIWGHWMKSSVVYTLEAMRCGDRGMVGVDILGVLSQVRPVKAD